MQINHTLPCLNDKSVAILVLFQLLPSFLITNQLFLVSPLTATRFLLSRGAGEDMVIRTSVQSLTICGYSFSKKKFLGYQVPIVSVLLTAKAGI